LNDQIRSRASERRVREIDATGAFTPEFERNADTERLVRRIPARLERCLRIRALFRDVDAQRDLQCVPAALRSACGYVLPRRRVRLEE
jgi:hypothetical protein